MGSMTEEAKELVRDKFRHHPPSNEAVVDGHELIRTLFTDVAEVLMQLLPDHPETKEALDQLDHACMQANAAMARTQGNPREDGTYPEISSLY